MNIFDIADLTTCAPPSRFRVDSDGVYFQVCKDETRRLTTVPAAVSEITRAISGDFWSCNLRWLNQDGQVQQMALPYSHIYNPRIIVERLAHAGLVIIPNEVNTFFRYLTLYLAQPDLPRVLTYRHLGFFTHNLTNKDGGLAFMMPDACLSPTAAAAADTASQSQAVDPLPDIRFHPDVVSHAYEAYGQRGTPEAWKEMLSYHGKNQSIAFFVCLGFAAPFLKLAGLDNFIVHLYGGTTTGKTTALQAALSIWGNGADPQQDGANTPLLERWNTTTNAIEVTAMIHSGMLLGFDELGGSGELEVYNITAGVGKQRMSDSGSLRDQYRWDLIVASTGELPFRNKIEESTGQKAKGGQLIRALDIPADQLRYDASLDGDDLRTSISLLKKGCAQEYGTIGRQFIQGVLNRYPTKAELQQDLGLMIDDVHAQFREEARAWVPHVLPAHTRALRRFAFIAATTHLAAETMVLPFSIEDAYEAIEAAAKGWLLDLPTISEVDRVLDNLRDYLVRFNARILPLNEWLSSDRLQREIPQDMRGIQKEHQLLLTKDQLTLACGETPTRRILQTFRDRGYMLVENEKMTSRRTIKELNIHHMPFYVFDLGKLHVVTDTPSAASTTDEAATAM